MAHPTFPALASKRALPPPGSDKAQWLIFRMKQVQATIHRCAGALHIDPITHDADQKKQHEDDNALWQHAS